MNQEVGIVKHVRDFLVIVEGLPTIKINDLVETEGGMGVVSALLEEQVSVWMLRDTEVKPGQMVKRSAKRLTLNIGEFLLGRAIDPLGIPIDGKRMLSEASKSFELEKKAPGISGRQFIKDQFDSGILFVDTLLPLGRGQRELVLGDARSGKTSFLIDLIVNQKGTGAICIYASIGKPLTDLKKLLDILSINKALEHTVIVGASSSDPPPLIFIAPKTAFTIAEYFQSKGKHVLLILDDLGNHAKIYREMSLLEGRSPGRESYPGDIFYQQAHLLERAGNFNESEGGGSITAIPVMEVNLADFTTFIPTNLMAMTDGHILFTSSLYNRGQRPAIDLSLSVTRVGGQTQGRVQNALATRVKTVITQASEFATLSRFREELPSETQLILRQKELIEEFLQQDPLTPYSVELQMFLFGLVFTKFLEDKDKHFIRLYKKKLIEAFTKNPKVAAFAKKIPSFTSEQALLTELEELEPTLTEICSLLNK